MPTLAPVPASSTSADEQTRHVSFSSQSRAAQRVQAGAARGVGEAAQIVAYLRRTGWCHSDRAGRLYLEPWLNVRLDDALCQETLAALRCAVPTLTPTVTRTLGAFFIERAHAERADVKAVHTGLERQLARLLDCIDQRLPLVSARIPTGAPHLINLRAPHYDGCLFNPQAHLGGGSQGIFLVGITPHKHAVAVKQVRPSQVGIAASALVDLTREAAATRRASRFDVLQLYATPDHPYMVMPLFNGDLQHHGHAFLSVFAPPGSGSAQGLFGARYMLRALAAEVDFLHSTHGVVHSDVKPENIFVQRDRKRFVLGDLGTAGRMNTEGSTRLRGYTPKLAAPEVFQGPQFIGPKVDIFGLATTLFVLLTDKCAPVMAYRSEHFPAQADRGLFFNAKEVPQMHEAHRHMVFEALDGTRAVGAAFAPTQRLSRYQAHFESVHKSVDHFDRPLGQLLRRMLQHSPEQRPTAHEVLAHMDRHMPLDQASQRQMNAVWECNIPRFSAEVTEELQRLCATLDTLTTTRHA